MLTQDEIHRWLTQTYGAAAVRRLGRRWVQVLAATDVGKVDVYAAVLDEPLLVGQDNRVVVADRPFLPVIRPMVDNRLETGAYMDPNGRIWAPGGHDREKLLRAVRKVADAVADRIAFMNGDGA